MTKSAQCYRCDKLLIKNGIAREDFETDTIMTGKNQDKPLRRFICKKCLTTMRGQITK